MQAGGTLANVLFSTEVFQHSVFPSSLLCAAVCYLGQEYPVSLADIRLQGGGSQEDCGNEQKEWLSSNP